MKHRSAVNSGPRAAVLGLAVSVLSLAHAAVFDVDTTLDLPDDGFGVGTCHTSAGTCSLRAAIMKANQIEGMNTVRVPAGTYVLTIPPGGSDADDTGDLNLTAAAGIDQTIAIVGAGASRTIIDGNRTDGVIAVDAHRIALLTGVTIRHGARANGGGGIVNDGGTMTIESCVIEDNEATVGGGILNTGSMAVLRSTIRSNVATLVGGGLYAGGQTLIRDSTVYGNGAQASLEGGGGLFSNNEMYVVDSTISGNYANGEGGGIYTYLGTTFLFNASVVGNDADRDRDEAGGIGGGIFANAGTRFGVVNALIAGNTIRDTPIPDNCNGALEAYGSTLLDDPTGCTTTTTNANLGFVSLDTIGPLNDNGGPTPTHALLAGSEAIDGTRDDQRCIDYDGAPLPTDQRDAPRIAGARCDVGAFEYGAVVPVVDFIFGNGFDGGM